MDAAGARGGWEESLTVDRRRWGGAAAQTLELREGTAGEIRKVRNHHREQHHKRTRDDLPLGPVKAEVEDHWDRPDE